MEINVTPLVDIMLVAEGFVKARAPLTFTYDEESLEVILQSENFLLKRTAFGLVNGSGFTVNARKLLQIANTLESETINLDVDTRWLTLKVSRSSYKIQQLDRPPAIESTTSVHCEFNLSISDTKLLQGMSKNANLHDFREAMQSVIVENRKGHLSFIATNGHVLVVAEKEFEGEPFSSPLIMPKSVAAGLQKVASYGDGITVGLGSNYILITGRDICLYLPRMNASTPNWRPFLKLPYDSKGTLPDGLESNVKLATSVSDKGDTKNKLTVPIRLTSTQGTLTLEVNADIKHYDELLNATIDSNRETVSSIEMDSPDLSEFQLVMNPNYLREALSHLKNQAGSSHIEMHLNSKEQILRLTNDSNLNYFIKVRQQG